MGDGAGQIAGAAVAPTLRQDDAMIAGERGEQALAKRLDRIEAAVDEEDGRPLSLNLEVRVNAIGKQVRAGQGDHAIRT